MIVLQRPAEGLWVVPGRTCFEARDRPRMSKGF